MKTTQKRFLPETPLIADETISNLPPLFGELCQKFSVKRERDICLTSMLGAASCLLPFITGRYRKTVLHANLYVIVCAPPASGKQVIEFARFLVEPFHDFLKEKSIAEQQENDDQKKKIVSFIIPADISAAMFLEILKNNGAKGLLFETEADSLTNSFKKEWGTYQDKLRCSFHHEPISYSRKSENESIEIRKPKISVVLAGTPGQIKSLLPSTENGLYSRFIFYAFTQNPSWESQTPSADGEDLEAFFKSKGRELLAVINQMTQRSLQFELSEEQWKTFNAFFKGKMQSDSITHGDDARSVVARMGVIVFRIAMILTFVRGLLVTDGSNKIICSDVDFSTAMSLGDVYLAHSKAMMEVTPDSTASDASIKIEEFYKSLPFRFSRSEAVRIGSFLPLATRSVDRYLQEFVSNKKLSKLQSGVYTKTTS